MTVKEALEAADRLRANQFRQRKKFLGSAVWTDRSTES